MRILHTADWHLGQSLHGISRQLEHDRFLAWLEDTLEAEEIDALVIAGDVFDTANPPASAQEAYYRFLARCRRRLPHLDIAVAGGNHDSPDRLDAPRALLHLDAIRVWVAGSLPRLPGGAVDEDRVIVPLRRRGREVAAQLILVPFLRRGELPALEREEAGEVSGGEERLAGAYRALYRGLTEAALRRRAPGQALLATGHCYMSGGAISELSERKIQVGNQHALPLDIFPSELAYVALGHLHHAQSVLGRENVRYSGSPIPLSMAESSYQHQVLVVDLEGERLRSIRKLYVPRAVDLLALPEVHAPLPEVLARLRALERREVPAAERPLLEVRVLLEAANPRLRRELEEALEGAPVRLVRIDARWARRAATSPEATDGALGARELGALSPAEVFSACHARARGAPPPPELLGLFAELLEQVERAS